MMTRKISGRCSGFLTLAFGAVLFLAGCAVGPDYETPEIEAVPDAWENAAAEDLADSNDTLDQWWTVMGDTILNNLVEYAGEASPDVDLAVARIREARGYHQIAGGDYYPQLGLDGSWTRTEVGENTALGGAIVGNNPQNNWEFGLGASWELDVFGRVSRTREATGALVEASIEDYRDVLVTLHAEVALNYTQVRTLQLRLIFALQNVKSQRETMEIVAAREDAGLVPLLDVTRARSNLANTEAAIPVLETALEESRNRLAILLGMTPGALDERLRKFFDLGDPETDLAVRLPAELLRRRPDVRRSERELASQTARIGVATADLYPTFSLTGFMNLQAAEFGNLADPGHLSWSLSPVLKWNLFTGGKIRGQIKVEEAKTEQLLAVYEKTVLNALAEVENTLVGLRQEEMRRELLNVAVEASQQSVELVHIQYIEGLTDFQSYLDAERTLFEQQDAFAQSRGTVFANLINLNRVLGGGWSLDDPAPDLPVEEDAVAANDSAEQSAQSEEVDR